jgi:hypothetical protein
MGLLEGIYAARYRPHSNGANIRLSAADGCQICSLFWNQMNEYSLTGQYHWVTELSKATTAYCLASESIPEAESKLYVLVLKITWGGLAITTLPFGIMPCMCSTIQRRKRLLTLGDVDEEPEGSESAIQTRDSSSAREWIISHWLHDCLKNHPECKLSTTTFWLPTRLIDLGPSDSQTKPRLIVTEGEGDLKAGPSMEVPKYATLSHCWGNSQPLKLLMSNLEEFKSALPPKRIPKTFSDAFRVAKSLGLRYIWVDSLCIVQDSHVDWLRESVTMGMVYSRSICSIAASGARDSNEGLFLSYRTSENTLLPFTCQWDNIPEIRCIISPMETSWRPQFENLPLNRRGWVLQERILAPRILHFTQDQVLWECRTHAASGMFPVKLPSHLQEYHNMRNQLFHPQPVGFYTFWADMIRSYTNAELTFTRDKLVAISGLASQRQSVNSHPSRYVAGMWEDHLPVSLLWTREDMFEREYLPRRLKDLHIPSWSWATLNCPIDVSWTLYDSNRADIASIQKFDDRTQCETLQPTTGNVLTIHAPLGQITWKLSSTWNGRAKQAHGYYIDTVQDSEKSRNSPNQETSMVSDNTYNVVIFDAFEEDEFPDFLWCLPIYVGKGNNHFEDGDSESHALYGLVINRVNEDTYRRVGAFRVAVSDSAPFTSLTPRTISLV